MPSRFLLARSLRWLAIKDISLLGYKQHINLANGEMMGIDSARQCGLWVAILVKSYHPWWWRIISSTWVPAS
jgi:hypothetical protein